MVNQDLESVRREYTATPLSKIEMASNPFIQFEFWMDNALNSDILDPTAACLSTADSKGKPSSRIILIKDVSEKGFVFYTNYLSKKGLEIEENNQASLLFYWDKLHRQVRIEGSISKIAPELSTSYFSKRPHDSQVAASISNQSHPIKNRLALEKKFTDFSSENNSEIHCPKDWGGYCLSPNRFEFWQGRPNRLHDRIDYTKTNKNWNLSRLQP
jgi:pyridoxamine 5'-phosphate oxidase